MRSLLAAVTVVASSVALGVVDVADAEPVQISGLSTALQRSQRIGNATSTATAPPPPAPPAPTVAPEIQEVLELVNAERTSRGLAPMRLSSELSSAAQAHTVRQAADGDIYHIDPRDGSTPGDRIARTGYRFSTWAENVAAGQRSPAQVMQSWMNSSGHCKNILNPAFTELGVGYVEDGQRYGTFWTQKFSRPRGVTPPAGSYNPAWC